MDPTPIVDGIVLFIQSNPKTAGFLALIPVVQMLSGIGARLTKREHPTIINNVLSWIARWPGPR